MRLRVGSLAAVSMMVWVAICGDVGGQTCPEYVKNRDPEAPFPLGSRADLPEGFVVYGINGRTGVYATPLNEYAPFVIEGTEVDTPQSISISDDGQWVFYLQRGTETMVIQRLDGSGRATHTPNRKCHVGGFYRQSPYGTEIFYLSGGDSAKAMQVDLSSEVAEFLTGTDRAIAVLSLRHMFANSWSAGTAVGRDQIFATQSWFEGAWDYHGRTGFLTIPNSGKGVASVYDYYEWENDDRESVFGCGHTMSWDGKYCAANSAFVGRACGARTNGAYCLKNLTLEGSGCLPNKYSVIIHSALDTQRFDHKGFYVTRFWRESDPRVAIDDIVDKNGISVNWAPPQYRRGGYADVDFNQYEFANHPSYMVGVLTGLKLRDYGFPNGIWVIDWRTNTWTSITPDDATLPFNGPAMYVLGYDAVQPRSAPAGMHAPLRGRQLLPAVAGVRRVRLSAGMGGVDLYRLDGKRVWSYRCEVSRAASWISLPLTLGQVALLAVPVPGYTPRP